MTDGPHAEDRPEPPRGSLPEPPWFALQDPGPPRGSPEAPPFAPTEYRTPESWSAGLEQLAVAGQQRARTGRRRRPTRLVVGVLAVIVTVVVVGVGVTVFLTRGGSPAAQERPRVAFCEVGTRGDTTTVAQGRDPSTPVGVVAAFLQAAISERSAAGARATMSTASVVPSAADLEAWISSLPPSTDGWCASVTTTESTARLLVDIRVRTADGVATVARGDTFYVSAVTPDRWTIDAVVAGDFAVDERVG